MFKDLTTDGKLKWLKKRDVTQVSLFLQDCAPQDVEGLFQLVSNHSDTLFFSHAPLERVPIEEFDSSVHTALLTLVDARGYADLDTEEVYAMLSHSTNFIAIVDPAMGGPEEVLAFSKFIQRLSSSSKFLIIGDEMEELELRLSFLPDPTRVTVKDWGRLTIKSSKTSSVAIKMTNIRQLTIMEPNTKLISKLNFSSEPHESLSIVLTDELRDPFLVKDKIINAHKECTIYGAHEVENLQINSAKAHLRLRPGPDRDQPLLRCIDGDVKCLEIRYENYVPVIQDCKLSEVEDICFYGSDYYEEYDGFDVFLQQLLSSPPKLKKVMFRGSSSVGSLFMEEGALLKKVEELSLMVDRSNVLLRIPTGLYLPAMKSLSIHSMGLPTDENGTLECIPDFGAPNLSELILNGLSLVRTEKNLPWDLSTKYPKLERLEVYVYGNDDKQIDFTDDIASISKQLTHLTLCGPTIDLSAKGLSFDELKELEVHNIQGGSIELRAPKLTTIKASTKDNTTNSTFLVGGLLTSLTDLTIEEAPAIKELRLSCLPELVNVSLSAPRLESIVSLSPR